MSSIYTTEYCSALKKNEIPTHAIIWMNFGDMMFSERSQSQKYNYYYDSTLMKCLEETIIETESKMVVAQSEGREYGGVSVSGGQNSSLL